MTERSIREYDGKRMIANLMHEYYVPATGVEGHSEETLLNLSSNVLQIDFSPSSVNVDWTALAGSAPWVLTSRLVAKPDQLIKRRGKGGLLLLNSDWDGVRAWISEHRGKSVTVDGVTGKLNTFLVEPYVPHPQSDEYYLCIKSVRAGEDILFHHEGGINVGDVDAKARRLQVPIGDSLDPLTVASALLVDVPSTRKAQLASFIASLFKLYMDCHYVYLEMNPLVVTGDEHTVKAGGTSSPDGLAHITPLDLAAKLDEAASYLVGPKWAAAGQTFTFPHPFGRLPEPEEAYIRELDGRTGASLKLTILNRNGRVWTMVAGGGASVAYADTISDLGFGEELANYGEYSGAPSEEQTYLYAKTILKLMGQTKRPEGKVLIIGGGIANFTDVAKTFTGIIRALREEVAMLKEHQVQIWVRRGGPNYQEGLKRMNELGEELNIPMHVYGPDTHITAIVPLALGVPDVHNLTQVQHEPATKENAFALSSGIDGETVACHCPLESSSPSAPTPTDSPSPSPRSATIKASTLFTPATRCIVFGMQERAIQGMLDFDTLCKRRQPSVAAIVFPFSGNHYRKFYYGSSEIMMPVFTTISEAVSKFPEVSAFVNFASFRSVYQTTMEALAQPGIRCITIIAEGVPEQHSRLLIREADKKKVLIIGPATVGGIASGSFRIANTGGMLDNIVACKLYRPGSVGYVSKSGGMSNELNNLMAILTDGVLEGLAIGGDRYPGSRFLDHVLRYEANPAVKMIVLLGEVGGVDEYEVCAALKDGRITKPLVAWCIGTCAKVFPFEVQFGHAGALAGSAAQTADAKNAALKEAGAIVPDNFNDFAAKIRTTYLRLVQQGVIVERPEGPEPKIPMDYAWAKQLGLVRKPTSFVSSISDDRGEELLYAGVPISKVFEQELGIGGVISLLWFRRRLPAYATKFIEMVLMVVADHGPAVSGAHNTIVTARAGKDLISSLCSGLLTIGPRFGGALDEAAAQFSGGFDRALSADQFVKEMRAANKLIMGIGHRMKSLTNPDKRVTLIKEYAFAHFPSTDVLKFALEVEKVTTQKKENLILNVDGAIAVCFVDLIRSCGAFTSDEADEILGNGCLNGLFVLGRSIGFIGHFLDQVHLKQGLYRHPTDDITYMPAEK